MCGRFALVDLSRFTDLFPWIRPPDEQPARYNIAASQPIVAVPNDGQNKMQQFLWGLIPPWADDPAIGNRMINARAETLQERAAFRNAYRRRRCLIPASGFYEWRKEGGRKIPMYIRMRGGDPFAFAGLWETWHGPDGGEVPSCTIITTDSNALLREIHDRMPAILKPEAYKQWLDPAEKKPEELQALLAPYPAERMEAYEVSRAVSNPKTEGAECVRPVAAENEAQPGLFGPSQSA